MEDCTYHPGQPSGTACEDCYAEYMDHMADLEEEAWRERRA